VLPSSPWQPGQCRLQPTHIPVKSSASGFSYGFFESTGIAVQALLRLTSALIILLYIFASDTADTGVADAVLPIGAFGCLLLASALIAAGSTPVLRFVCLCADVTALSLLLCYSPSTLAPLYLLYLVITTAYGFRYGEAGLLLAAGLSAIGFALVIATTPFWQDLAPLSVGLLIGLLGVPLYNLRFIRKVSQEKSVTEHDNAIKSEFMANMSHGLRTPVNTLIGLSYLLQGRGLTPEHSRYLSLIKKTAEELEKAVSQALHWFRLEAGSVVLFNEPFDLYQAVTDSVQILLPQADAKGIRLSLRINPATPVWVEGDSHKLGQVLINLIANAVKFTARGYVRVDLSLLEQRPGQAVIGIAVEDSGIGIADTQKRRILEPYCQATATIERDYGGSGLGTAIARKIIALMGGDLWFQSVPDQGTTFWFKVPLGTPNTLLEAETPAIGRLRVLAVVQEPGQPWLEPLRRWLETPLDAVQADDARLYRMAALEPPYEVIIVEAFPGYRERLARLQQLPFSKQPEWLILNPSLQADRPADVPTAEIRELPVLRRALYARALWEHSHDSGESPAIGSSGRALRLLVAEDNSPHQLIMRAVLEGAGHQVDMVDDGLKALTKLHAGAYDVAIFDSQMHPVSGLETLQRYHAATPRERVPVIIISADAAPESAQQFQQAGAAHYLTKPLKPAMLLWVIAQTLEATATRSFPHNPAPSPTARLKPMDSVKAGAFNVSYLRKLAAQTAPGFLENLVRSFLVSSAANLETLAQAIASGDSEAYRSALHSLANSALALGADALGQRCQQTLSMTAQEFPLRSLERLEELKQAHAAVEDTLEDFLYDHAALN